MIDHSAVRRGERSLVAAGDRELIVERATEGDQNIATALTLTHDPAFEIEDIVSLGK